MASINLPVNIKKLLADQQTALIANTDEKAVETQAHVDAKITETKNHVTTKSTETKNLVSAENDDTQVNLALVKAKSDQIEIDIQGINPNTDAKVSGISFGVVKSLSRGSFSQQALAGNGFIDVTVAPVNVNKSVLNVLSYHAEDANQSYRTEVKLLNSTTVRVDNLWGTPRVVSLSWELVEYE